MSQPRLISDQLAGFVLDATLDRIPAEVQHWCKLLMLDAIGNAYAATRFEFSHKGLTALHGLAVVIPA